MAKPATSTGKRKALEVPGEGLKRSEAAKAAAPEGRRQAAAKAAAKPHKGTGKDLQRRLRR